MTQKKYQKLSSDNHFAAREIWEELKTEKVLSQENFEINYANARGISYGGMKSGSFHNLYKTTQQFLFDHGLMTKELINGLIVYVATQKCFRCKTFENATKVAQVTTDALIDKAIAYVEINNNQIPAEFEGPIVANMLGLDGKVWKEFVDYYVYQETWNPKDNYNLPIKYKVIGVVMTLVGDGLLKKV
jgi:hypothetical protein